jgi:hypothetical protein
MGSHCPSSVTFKTISTLHTHTESGLGCMLPDAVSWYLTLQSASDAPASYAQGLYAPGSCSPAAADIVCQALIHPEHRAICDPTNLHPLIELRRQHHLQTSACVLGARPAQFNSMVRTSCANHSLTKCECCSAQLRPTCTYCWPSDSASLKRTLLGPAFAFSRLTPADSTGCAVGRAVRTNAAWNATNLQHTNAWDKSRLSRPI